MGKSILGIIFALFACLSARAEQPTFNISSTDAMPGETIEVNFEVDNFIDIISVQYSVNWDPAVLEFVTLKNFNADVPGLSPSVFGTPQVLLDQGKFTLAWIESSITPITIPDGSLFFTVEFEVVGAECQSSAVEITDDPLEIEVAEDGEVPVGLIANNGLVNIPGSGCAADIMFIGNSIVGDCGSNVCIEFTVENFQTVGAMEFSLVYDPAVLQFTEFKNFAPLTGFGSGNTNLLEPGVLRVLWFDSNVENDTLPDGTVLFEICFDVIGSGGQSSDITFGDNPSPSITDIDGNPHVVGITPASITAQCQLEGFALLADSMCTMPNDIVCFNVTVNDFEDIIALQFSINWDSTVFIFDHVEGFGIPGLDESGFGTPTFPDVDEGELTISWLDLSLDGVTLPDYSTIFRVCLQAVGASGTSSPITFSGVPLDIEIATLDSTLDYTLVPGFGEIETTCDGCPLSYTLTSTPPSCPGECDATITLDLMDCPETPTFLWSNGETTQNLTGLCAGDYTVTITLGSQVAIATETIADPEAMAVSGTVTDPNPPGTMTGSIDITISGGCEPYTYEWSSGQMTEDIDNLGPGTYIVTVTDCMGCSFTPDAFVVGAELVLAVDHVTCFGGSDGAINLSVAFGTGPYTFMWDTDPVQTTKDIANLPAGDYCVTVTDSGGSTRDTCVTVSQPDDIVITATVINDVNEDCMGAIDLNVVGGVMPYSYLWSGGQTTQDLTGLCGGQYCVTITDGQGCQKDTCFIVFTGGLGVELVPSEYGDFEVSCFDVCDGEITTVVFGGGGMLSYLWSNGETTADLTDLCAGTYSLTVTDEGERTATATIELTSPGPFELAYLTTNPTDYTTSDGSISVIVNGGVPPYTYSWSGPVSGNTPDLDNVPAGTYTVVITDANGCTITDSEQLLPDLDVDCYTAITVITPNGDGKNDQFIISCVLDNPNELAIYNRFGGLVYEVTNYQNDWDGVNMNNEPVTDGGYLWVLQVTRNDGSIAIYKGTVNLLRSAD